MIFSFLRYNPMDRCCEKPNILRLTSNPFSTPLINNIIPTALCAEKRTKNLFDFYATPREYYIQNQILTERPLTRNVQFHCEWSLFFERRNQMIKTQPSRRDFFIVANSIFELQLKPRDFAVYCCLLRHADIANHTCFPSRRTISKECQIDKKTVDVALNSLIDIGLIRKITRTRFDGSKTSNLYHVVDLTKTNNE